MTIHGKMFLNSEKKEVMIVIIYNNKQRKGSQNREDYYKPEVCINLGINPRLPLIICGQKAEPQNAWNPETKKFDGGVESMGYWVTQNVTDQNGNSWVQNPILVLVNGQNAKEFKFGQMVTFDGLAGYYSRKKFKFSFRAKSIRGVKNE